MAADPFPWTCWKHGPASPNAWGCPECMRELRTDDKQMSAFVLLHYGTPRKLADLLDEIHKGLDESFNPRSQNRLESAAFWIDKQACEDAAAEARAARIAHMCDYEDRDND